MTQKFYNCRGAIYLTLGCELLPLGNKNRERESERGQRLIYLILPKIKKKLAGFNANCQFKLITQI